MDAWIVARGDAGLAGEDTARLDAHFKAMTREDLGAGIPARYADWSLQDFKATAAREMVRFIEDESVSTLFLHGGVGTGKTTLAAAVLRGWRWSGGACSFACPENCGLRLGTASLFLPAYEAADKLRDLDGCRDAMARWAGVRFLVLDDIGANRSTPHVTEQLLFLLQRRYDHVQKTVVTSNLDLDGIHNALGERAASRLQQGLLVELTGGDKRGGSSERKVER